MLSTYSNKHNCAAHLHVLTDQNTSSSQGQLQARVAAHRRQLRAAHLPPLPLTDRVEPHRACQRAVWVEPDSIDAAAVTLLLQQAGPRLGVPQPPGRVKGGGCLGRSERGGSGTC